MDWVFVLNLSVSVIALVVACVGIRDSKKLEEHVDVMNKKLSWRIGNDARVAGHSRELAMRIFSGVYGDSQIAHVSYFEDGFAGQAFTATPSGGCPPGFGVMPGA